MARSNPTRSDLCGAVLPWPHSLTLAADYAHGTDYTEANRRVGVTTHDASSRPPGSFVADASKAPDDSASQTQLMVRKGGNAGIDGATVVSRASSSDPWRGADTPLHMTGRAQSVVASGASQSSIVALDDGSALMAVASVSGDDIEVHAYTRAVDGTWGSAVEMYSVTMESTPSYAPVLLMWHGPPTRRALLLFGTYVDPREGATVACWRSTDEGATWTLQTGDVGITVPAVGIRWLAGTSMSGTYMLLFTTQDSGSSSLVKQFESRDGGITMAQVGDNTASSVVWSVANVAGIAVVAHNRGGNAKVVRISSSRRSWADEESEISISGMDYVAGMAILASPTGKLWLRIAGVGGASDGAVYTSTDNAATWTLEGTYDHAANFGPGISSACVLRGQQVVLHNQYDPSGPSVNGQLMEVAYGGIADVTLSSALSFPSVRYVPVQRLDEDGWVTSDTLTPSRTLGADYSQIECPIATTAQDSRTIGASSAEYSLAARVVARSFAGIITLRFQAATTIVDVDLLPTQVRAYESGTTAPAYTTTHENNEFLDICVAVRSSDGTAAVYVRVEDGATDRAYTQLATLSGMASGGSGLALIRVLTPASGTARIRSVSAGVESSYGGGLTNGIDRPDDLEGIPIAATGYSYIGEGVHARSTGGPYPVDGTIYSVPVTSANPKASVLPQSNPSPSSGLVTSSGDACTLRFTGDYAAGTAQTLAPPGAWVAYLDGLVGVGDVTVYDTASGASIGSFSRPSIEYELQGSVLRVTTMGASTPPDAYVHIDEMAGWYFESANGKVRRIRSNTDGSFDGTDSGHAVTLFLDDFDGTESSVGTGYLYPSRMLIVIYQRGVRRMDQLRLELAAHTAFDGKQVGLVASGPLQLMGRGVDKTQSVSLEDGQTVTTLDDGTRSASGAASMRRRWEFGIGLDSVVDLRDVLEDMSTLPDHVDISDHASAKPAGTRHATPLSVQGLYSAAQRDPLVFLPSVARDDGAGDRAVCHIWRDCEGATYGRLMNSTRRTLTLGRQGRNGMWRSSNIAIEEEL